MRGADLGVQQLAHAVDAQVQDGRVTQVLGQLHGGRNTLVGADHMQVLRAQADALRGGNRQSASPRQRIPQLLVRHGDAAGTWTVDHHHARRAQKGRHELIRRPVVKLHRRTELLDPALVEHRDPIAHRHRLDLVVGDINHRRAEFLVQPRQLDAHVHAQCGVQVGQRLVEQEHLGLAHDRAADRDALTLSARELPGVAPEQFGDVQDRGGAGDLFSALCLADPGHLQREAHVFSHRHVRVQGVALEHHRRTTVGRAQVVGALAVDQQVAGGDAFKPRDHPQRRRLAAA